MASELEALLVQKAVLEERLTARAGNRARIVRESTPKDVRKWDKETRKLKRDLKRVKKQMRKFN